MNNENKKYLDINGLSHLKLLLDNILAKKVNKELKTGSTTDYKVLSDNNLTDDLLTKIQNAGVSDFTGSYDDLKSKPKINNVILSGELSLDDLGIQPKGAYALLSEIPTNNNQLINGSEYQTASDVVALINSKISSTYKAKGTITFANLPELSDSVEGFVYNISDSFTTTSDFVEGAGNKYPSGTNVVIINVSGTYKYDVLAGFVDLSDYVKTSDFVAITNDEIAEIFGG